MFMEMLNNLQFVQNNFVFWKELIFSTVVLSKQMLSGASDINIIKNDILFVCMIQLNCC